MSTAVPAPVPIATPRPPRVFSKRVAPEGDAPQTAVASSYRVNSRRRTNSARADLEVVPVMAYRRAGGVVRIIGGPRPAGDAGVVGGAS